MNGKFRAVWRWLTTSKHTAWLETEVERLRAECAEARRQNWALVNSLVTTAGAPLPQEVLRQAQGAPEAAPSRAGASASARRTNGRRSWHQVARALEIESARPARPAAQTASERLTAVRTAR